MRRAKIPVVLPSKNPIIIDQSFNTEYGSFTFDDYTPKNNKLYSAPYCYLTINDNKGNEVAYNLEDFTDGKNVSFTESGDVSVNPSILIYPKNYKGILENLHHSFTLDNFPQSSFNTDAYKLWLNKNAHTLGTNVLDGAINLAAGIALTAATNGIGLFTGGYNLMSRGAKTINDTVGSSISASHEANRVTVGNTSSNLLTGLNKNYVNACIKHIRYDDARAIDEYFTMFGYQTNKVKIPNISSRPYFNYVQTIDVNIIGKIPADDMQQIKTMFNSGVTFWKSTATVGDYNVKNNANKKIESGEI